MRTTELGGRKKVTQFSPQSLKHGKPQNWAFSFLLLSFLPGPPASTVRQAFILLLKVFIYFWLLWVFDAAHGLSPVMGSGGDSLVAEHGLRSRGSIVGAHGLSCPMGCGFFLDQGLNLRPRVLDPWTPGKPHASFLEDEGVDAESRVLRVWYSPACLLQPLCIPHSAVVSEAGHHQRVVRHSQFLHFTERRKREISNKC